MLSRLRKCLRRKTYRRGEKLSRFLAPDVRREVEVVDDSEVAEGFVVVRIRTYNVLHAVRLGVAPGEPSEPKRVAIDELWTWTGQPWGGPIPEDDVAKTPR